MGDNVPFLRTILFNTQPKTPAWGGFSVDQSRRLRLGVKRSL